MTEKILSVEEAMAAFMAENKGAEEVVTSGNFNAGFRLQNDENKKLYARGVLLRRREAQGRDGKPQAWYTFKLIATNAPITKGVKKGDKTEYVQVPFVAGNEYDTLAATDLDRKLKDIPAGSEVMMVYNGMVAKATKKGKVRMHSFTVTRAAETIITEEEVDL